MTKTEIITICISTLAILLSGISIYFQFFRKKTSALLRLLNAEYSEEKIVLCYSLINSGNQDLLLKDVYFPGYSSNLGQEVDSYRNYDCKCLKVRTVIEPGKICSANVKVSIKDVQNKEPEERPKQTF